jgi:hypothetical protein
MKLAIKKRTTGLLLLALTAGSISYAQNTVTATWALTSDPAASVSGAGAAAVSAAPQTLRGLTVADKNAYSANGQRTAPGGVGGPWIKEAGPANDRFVLYTVTVGKGSTLSVTQVQLDLGLEGTNSNSVNVAWATDTAHFTNVTPDFRMVGVATPGTKTFTLTQVIVPAGKTFYLRVSPWTTGNASGGKFLVSRNVMITGTVSKP